MRTAWPESGHRASLLLQTGLFSCPTVCPQTGSLSSLASAVTKQPRASSLPHTGVSVLQSL